jgi:hypothetical protein
LEHLRAALCKNQIDFVFLSDHPDNQTLYSIRDLILPREGDQILYKNGLPYANQMKACDNSQLTPFIMTGFESKLMALGMEKHLPGSPGDLNAMYTGDSFDLRSRLDSEANALVVIPHTESRTVNQIEAVQPDAIEIYNIHANLDPKIRKQSLGLSEFGPIANLLTYLVDPYHQLTPDFAFFGFLYVSPIYAQRWGKLIADGYPVTALAGTDAHENLLSQTLNDGERVDSFRRIIKIVSNHLLVTNIDPDSIKTAIRRGRGWVVYEGFGTPTGMDFYAKTSTQVLGVGDSGRMGGEVSLVVPPVSLHPLSPRGSLSPDIQIEIKKVNSDGGTTTVASSNGSGLTFNTSTPGAYRAEVSIVPKHLKEFLDVFSKRALQKYTWIVTNHIFLEP